MIGKDAVAYTSHYCEENVALLCKYLIEAQPAAEVFAVLISNDRKQVPIWYQKPAWHPDEPVVWDYHVVLLLREAQRSWTYDFDTTLGWPCEAVRYVSEAFKPDFDMDLRFVAILLLCVYR
jgi:protein N-terminal glutamine amidohydrolase